MKIPIEQCNMGQFHYRQSEACCLNEGMVEGSTSIYGCPT